MRFLFIFLILSCLHLSDAMSQKFEWMAGFDGFLDNREYFSIHNPQTIFGSRIKGEIGASLADVHRFRFGLNYLYEFGGKVDAYNPDPIMYYQYDDDRVMFNAGAFPRRYILDYPLALLSDTLHYYRPNIEGAYFGLRGDWGYQNVFIDWTSRQTDVDYEQFLFGFSGQVNWNSFFLNHHFLMGHFAGTAVDDPSHHLRDNGGFDLNLGIDLSENVFLDTLIISLGGLVSVDRTRNVDESWQTPAGFLGQATARYRWIGLSGTYYNGQGHTFLYGDPFYQLKQYGRLDIFCVPVRNSNVSIKINFVMHFAESQIDYSQQLLVSMNLDGFRNFRNK